MHKTMKSTMLNGALIVAMALALSASATPQSLRQRRVALVPTKDAPANCSATFVSGNGDNATQYCVTVNGNIIQFSRGGDEYIQGAKPIEGYGICDVSPGTAYFDYAFNNSGNWGPSTFSSTATRAISTRTSSDGIWEITNTITQVAASGSHPGAATVTMKIVNQTGILRTIVLIRAANVDFKRAGAIDTNNDFDHTADTVTGLEPGFNSGLSLINNTFSDSNRPFAQGIPDGPNPCSPFSGFAHQPFVGDGSLEQFTEFNVPKFSSKTITLTYQPI